jgi:hypothetical protein
MGTATSNTYRVACIIGSTVLTVACASYSPKPEAPASEMWERMQVAVAAASMQDAVVVDCQLPGTLRKLGGTRTYLTPGKLARLPAVDCRNVGGDYLIADLSSGTLSLARWMPLAEQGDAEAQYYVARIYANGMSGVTADYATAATWYQKASAQNYKSATLELAYLYEQGLGVPQDRMLALNMQRTASGLGEDLDYSSKIALAQEEAARQVAAMNDRLEESNAALQDLRGKLVAVQGTLTRNRSELARSEDAVLDLRKQLATARTAGGTGVDPARVKQLESALAAKEQALATNQQRIASLERDLAAGQEQLAANLASSQASSAELTRLLASSQAEAKSLRARAAQTEQRLISSQEELRQLRTSYRQEVDRLTSQADQLEKLRKSADGGVALVTEKQRELDRQALRVQTLERELAAAKASSAATAADEKSAAASANARAKESDAKLTAANAQNASLRESVAALQARFDEQSKLLQTQRTELAALQGKGQADRTALVQSLTDKLQKSSLELQAKQRRLASLESETSVLRTQYKLLQDEASKDQGERASQVQGLRNALSMAQQRRTEDANELDRLRTESAKERYEILQQKEELQRALAAGQQKTEREVARLNMMIQERQEIIQVKEKLIASLQKQLDEPATTPLLAQNLPMRSASASSVKLDPEAAKLLSLAQTSERSSGRRYTALVIGNSNYAFMAPLATPINDARDVGDVLRNNYGFEVRSLYDATSDQIMRELYSLSQTLTDKDNLLIYYAGHGDQGPSNSAYWLGTEADKVTKKGWIPLDYIRDQIKNMKARHIMVVADACFAGAMTHAKTMSVGRGVSEKRFQLQWNRRARMVLTSGQNTPVIDSGGSRDHSIFATYFIQVLRQNMLLMSGEMLSYELNGRIVPEARKLGVDQQPTYSTLGDANHDFGEFFFVPVPTKLAALNTGG